MVLWFDVCNKELLALRNNFRVTKKFLIAKFDCTLIWIPDLRYNLEFIYFRDLDGPYWMACMGQCLGGNAVEKGLTPKFIHPMTKTLCNDNFCFCDGGCGPCGGCWTCCRPCNSCVTLVVVIVKEVTAVIQL